MNADLTLNEELYNELFLTLRTYPDVEYVPNPIGLCSFTVGLIDIVCVDILEHVVECNKFLVIFDIKRAIDVLQEPFSSLKEMHEILMLVSNNIKTLQEIINDTKWNYMEMMRKRMILWTPLHTESLQEFLQLADADYWKFITDTY